jgi:hypothetical protein
MHCAEDLSCRPHGLINWLPRAARPDRLGADGAGTTTAGPAADTRGARPAARTAFSIGTAAEMIGELAKWLVFFGSLLTLIAAWYGVRGVWVTEDQALEIGQMRLSGENRDRDPQLPAVQNLLNQFRLAMKGFVLIGVGTALQIVGVFIPPRQSPRGAQMAPAAPPRPPTPEQRDPRRRPRAQRPRR